MNERKTHLILMKRPDQLKVNLNIIFSNIRDSMGKNDNALIFRMGPEDIQEKIEKHLPVRKYEKDKFGEVFTPINLIEDMLNKLPPSVWTDPTQKWLDPANGIGNYHMVVYKRLMGKDENYKGKGLPDTYNANNIKYSNEQEKSTHILSKMLYMCELNQKNIQISKKIFGPNTNICCGDFLNEEGKWRNQFKMENVVDKFDIIIGNPPFNASQENEGKKGGGDTLWPKFVVKSLDILKTNGYLLFVHPSSWRKPESENSRTNGLFNIMAHENHIEYLEIHDKKDGINTFNAITRYDWYLIKKTKNNSKTIVKDQKGILNEIDLSKWGFLPNYNMNKIKGLLSDSEQDYVIYSRNQFGTDKSWTSEEKKGEYKYPLIHSTAIGEPRKYWSSTKTPSVQNIIPMFGVPKVIFGESGINNVIIDSTGKYGLTQGAIGLKIKGENEGKLYKRALESAHFKDIVNAMSFGNFRIDWRMFKYFKPDFYKNFLNKNEVKTKKQNRRINGTNKTRKTSKTRKNNRTRKFL